MLVNIGQHADPSRSRASSLRWRGRSSGEATYAFEGIINFTGATIDWLRDQLQLIETPAGDAKRWREAVPDNGGVYSRAGFRRPERALLAAERPRRDCRA